IALAELMPVGILGEAEHGQRAPLGLAEARMRALVSNAPEPARYRIERIGKVAPRWRRVRAVGGEPAARPLPAGEWTLRVLNFFRAHAVEEIVFRVVLADMVEAQEAPRARTVEIGRLKRRLELARSIAAGNRAPRLRAFNPPVQPSVLQTTTSQFRVMDSPAFIRL